MKGQPYETTGTQTGIRSFNLTTITLKEKLSFMEITVEITVEPRLTDTPQQWIPTIQWNLP